MFRDVTITRNAMIRIFALAGLLGLAGSGLGQVSSDQLERGFKEPPESAKPRVWWHWMNGNVTKEGITADLEWMKRVGIAGMQMFDGSLGIPQFIEKRLVWMTPEWKDALRHAAAEADRLGLEMSMAASGGWSETAGPWVKPEQGMKKVVWSETRLRGPRAFAGALPNPPSVNGRFQNIPTPSGFEVPEMTDLPGAKPAPKAPPAPPDPTYYADVAVIAYRVPDDELRMVDLHPKVTSSAGGIDAAALMDGDFGKTVALPIPEGAKNAWVQFEFTQPYRAQAFSIAVRRRGNLRRRNTGWRGAGERGWRKMGDSGNSARSKARIRRSPSANLFFCGDEGEVLSRLYSFRRPQTQYRPCSGWGHPASSISRRSSSCRART